MSANDASRPNGTAHDKQRAFLQSLFSRPVLTLADAKPLIAAIETAHTPERPTPREDITQEDFDLYIQTANDALLPFDFEIRSTLCQTSKERVYALVNTTSDALTQMATIHTADEIAFVKRVLDAMFDTYNTPRAEIMALTSMQALKLNRPVGEGAQRRASGDPSQASTGFMSSALSLSQAERVLKDMVEEGWFELSEHGFYSLTPRALMELRTWLIDTYNDQEAAISSDDDEEEEQQRERIKFCAACRDIVTVGQRCPNLGCNCRMHDFCVRNKFRAQGNREQCPTCQTDWKNAPSVGERAVRVVGGHGTSGRVNGSIASRTVSGRSEGDESEASSGASE